MRVLHTSDWHLGRALYGRKRYEEFTDFLDWLAQAIIDENVDVLLIAGDVFDTSTPSNRAQELYYRFLCRVAASPCRHVVVIAGNHDSPSFLNAPKALLKTLSVYVVGAISESLEDEIVVLHNQSIPEAIICAVPYLRDRDIRTIEPGETIDDKNAKLVDGLRKHYAEVCQIADKARARFVKEGYDRVPIIGMGHLFAAGGQTIDGDGVRELYVGSLAHVGADIFPLSLDYMALGHLHVPQVVSGREYIRYCGSPIPMGYGEAAQNKLVLIVDFEEGKSSIRELRVPCFQALVRISGSSDEIQASMDQLKIEGSDAWVEIEYTGKEVVGNLRHMLDELVADSKLEVLRVKNRRVVERVIGKTLEEETLDDLSVEDVFTRMLDTYDVPQDDRLDLRACHNQVIQSLHESDANAE